MKIGIGLICFLLVLSLFHYVVISTVTLLQTKSLILSTVWFINAICQFVSLRYIFLYLWKDDEAKRFKLLKATAYAIYSNTIAFAFFLIVWMATGEFVQMDWLLITLTNAILMSYFRHSCYQYCMLLGSREPID